MQNIKTATHARRLATRSELRMLASILNFRAGIRGKREGLHNSSEVRSTARRNLRASLAHA